MKYSLDELALIWLDSFAGLEYHKKQVIFSKIKGKTEIKRLITENRDYIVAALGEKGYSNILNSANKDYFDFVMAGLNKEEVVAITIESELYPEELKNTSIPPLVLYAKGNLKLLKDKKFGIVGSRKSLPLSIKLAQDYTASLANDFTLVTGIAEGIDSTVIETALKNNGRVISVIAGGFNNIYPKSNYPLYQELLKKGLVISEYPPDTMPMPYFFPVRNRIIAGLSKGVLIVSGGIKSGTLYTAEYALEYGRDVFAIPYSPNVESGMGCNDIIKRGASLTDSINDILDFYGLEVKEKNIELNSQEKEIISVLSNGEVHVEKIAQALNRQTFEILPILSVLEIKGIIIKSGVNKYSLIKANMEA